MTIFFPDLSHYDLNRGVSIELNTVAVIVKGTHGVLFVDPAYPVYKRQAASASAYFTAYHWLNHGDGAAQARYCWAQLGRVPVMVDAEDMPGNTGYTGPLTVADLIEFVTALRSLGGISNLAYVPRWYWQNDMGSPDLTPLARAGIGVVSSNYTAYADGGPGWDGYGGVAPVQWQYTDKLPYGGDFVDFNAYLGTLPEYIALTSKETPVTDPLPTLERFPPGLEQMVADWWHYFREGKGAFGGTELAAWTLPKLWAQTAVDAASAAKGVAALQAPAAPVPPTQDQVDAAMLKAMQDPGVQAGIAAALAAHLHVS